MADIAHTINSLWNFRDRARARSNRCWAIDDAENDTKHSIVAYLVLFSCRNFIDLFASTVIRGTFLCFFVVASLHVTHTCSHYDTFVYHCRPTIRYISIFLQSFAMGKRSSRIHFPNVFCHRSGRRQTVSATHCCEMIQNKFWVRRRRRRQQNTHECDMTNERTNKDRIITHRNE